MSMDFDKILMNVCQTCGHHYDHHIKGDLFYQFIFGKKLGDCEYYDVDSTLPIWKRRNRYCSCKKFVSGMKE